MPVREAEQIPNGPAKERFVRRVFAAIAPTYDVMNVVMSAGCIHYWLPLNSQEAQSGTLPQ